MSIDSNQYSILGGTSEQFTNPAVGDLRIFGNATAANESIASYKEETRKSGGYFILNMDAYDQLYFEAAARYERSSTFEENVFYPSASIGWKFSDLVNNDILSFGKVRVAYGEIGITPEPYSTTTTYGPGISAIVTGIPNLPTIRPVANSPTAIESTLTARSICAQTAVLSARLRSLSKFFNSK